MKEGNLRNIVVLKNLPSNIVEEAIVILKTNKMAKKVQKIEKTKNGRTKEENKTNHKDYVLREAEMLISSYVNNIEKEKVKKKEENISIKYTRIKKYACIATFLLIIESLIIIAG